MRLIEIIMDAYFGISPAFNILRFIIGLGMLIITNIASIFKEFLYWVPFIILAFALPLIPGFTDV